MSDKLHPPSRAPEESLADPSVEYLRDALRVAVPVEAPDVVQKRRERLVASIEGEIRNLPARQKREEQKQRWASLLRYGGAAAVLAATLGLGMLLTPQGDRPPLEAKQASSSSIETSPGSGSVLVTNGRTERIFELPGETRVSLRANSRVELFDDSISSQVMNLERGGVFVSVPPATGGAHRSVSVLTPHAKVRVKGTRFSVDLVGKDAENQTRVAVERGVVEVTHAEGVEILRAGQSWTSAVGALLPEEGEAAARTMAPETKATAAPGGRSNPNGDEKANAPVRMKSSESPAGPKRVASRESTLAMQNALLEAALVAAEAGHEKRALDLTGQLLRDYPTSPLRAAAYAVRRRVKREATKENP